MVLPQVGQWRKSGVSVCVAVGCGRGVVRAIGCPSKSRETHGIGTSQV
jgi:hypothetical protein